MNEHWPIRKKLLFISSFLKGISFSSSDPDISARPERFLVL